MPADTASSDSSVGDAELKAPGELLQEGRKDTGLSVEQVADKLHLDDRVIEALEAGHFDEIGAPVFVRGHLKAYARVLRIDEEAVLEAYRASLPEEPDEPVLAQRQPARRGSTSPGPWIMGLVALVLVIGLGIYVSQDDPAPAGVATPEPAAPEPASPGRAADILPPPAPVEPADDASPASAGDVSGAIRAAAPAPEPAPEQAPGSDAPAPSVVVPPAEPAELAASAAPEPEAVAPAPGIRLELYFRDESWVEISNAERRILFGLQREGMRRQLTGEPPIQILLGNAPGVDVYVDGEPYAVPANSITGKVARFSVGAAQGDNP